MGGEKGKIKSRLLPGAEVSAAAQEGKLKNDGFGQGLEKADPKIFG